MMKITATTKIACSSIVYDPRNISTLYEPRNILALYEQFEVSWHMMPNAFDEEFLMLRGNEDDSKTPASPAELRTAAETEIRASLKEDIDLGGGPSLAETRAAAALIDPVDTTTHQYMNKVLRSDEMLDLGDFPAFEVKSDGDPCESDNESDNESDGDPCESDESDGEPDEACPFCDAEEPSASLVVESRRRRADRMAHTRAARYRALRNILMFWGVVMIAVAAGEAVPVIRAVVTTVLGHVEFVCAVVDQAFRTGGYAILSGMVIGTGASHCAWRLYRWHKFWSTPLSVLVKKCHVERRMAGYTKGGLRQRELERGTASYYQVFKLELRKLTQAQIGSVALVCYLTGWQQVVFSVAVALRMKHQTAQAIHQLDATQK